MGWRQKKKRGYYPWYVTFGSVWNGNREGRWWKRKLSKIRRRAWKDPHERGLASIESTCNWKAW